MKILSSLKSIFKLALVTTAVLATSSLTNCGGGGGGESDATVRPKSLNRLLLTLEPSTIALEFVRSATSQSALKNGQREEGAVRFTNLSVLDPRQMLDNSAVDVVWPSTTERITYRYTPINDAAGELQLIVARAGYAPTNNGGPANALIRLFYFSTTDDVSHTNFTMNFSSDGNTLQTVNIRVGPRDLNAPQQWIHETWGGIWGNSNASITDIQQVSFLVDGAMTIAETGEPVPVNYNSNEFDSDTPADSRISPLTLNKKSVFFFPDNPALAEFSAACVTLVLDPSLNGESGTVILYDDAGVANIGSGAYDYERILNSDSTNFELTGGTGEDNKYKLNFRSLESAPGAPLTQRASGFYKIVAGGTGDPGLIGETGFFYVRDSTPIAP